MKHRNLTIALVLLLLFAMLAGCSAPTARIPDQTTPLAAPDGVNAYPSPDPDMISQQLAMDIALLHAGVQADDAEYVQIEFDYDDGIPEFDVQFYVGRTEYEYEINANNGSIISWEKDYD